MPPETHDPAMSAPRAAQAPKLAQSRPSLAARLLRYQASRFQLAGFIPLITAFTFSSAAYSRVARGAAGFIPWPRFVIGTLTALTFFWTLRVLDEHKDAEQDRRYRPELPVPSGLVSLAELRLVAGTALAIVIVLNAIVAPRLLVAMALVAAWAALMTKEFFVREWLRRHLGAYLVTHMAIMPLIDGYTTGLDWLADGHEAPPGLVLFLLVTFWNGVVIEIGRKLRAPADEREGVDTYTAAWGVRWAPFAWLLALAGAAATAWAALGHVGATVLHLPLLLIAASCALPALAFLARPNARSARLAEWASQLWPLATYLLLGALPFLSRGRAM